jgi:alkylhydroperoxidase/carboxymuconolactone decarboxylase family protein YurZ
MGWSDELSERSSRLSDALKDDKEFMATDTALPRWVKNLMAMQLDSIANHPAGSRWYGRQALETGATEEQLIEAIELLYKFAGRPAVATAAAVFEAG